MQRSRIISQERVDLADFQKIENFVCADFAALHKYIWSNQNFVVSGFTASGTGTSTLAIEVAGSALLLGASNGTMYIGSPSLSNLATSSLTPASTNYIEITIDQDSGGNDSRAFWDQTANGGLGAEFSQIVDTFIFLKPSLSINTSNFTGSSDKVAICEVDVSGGGVITAIRDARNLFFRLGRASNLSYNFPWSSRTEPVNTQFTGADKDIDNLKQFFDAIMDSIREIKGTTYWYEIPNVSLTGSFRNVGLTTLTAATLSARYSWSGTTFSITDDSTTPGSTDVLAYLRFFNSVANLELTRQDGGSAVTLSDGDVLWIEISDPLADTVYDGIGNTATNFRVSARGHVPLQDTTFWLAYREGSRVFVRGMGEMKPGESIEISDETPESLTKFLGFDPETATSVPYTSVPNSLIFGNLFDTNSTLVTAISTNCANINAIGLAINTPAYAEIMDFISGIPSDSHEMQGPIISGTSILLPLDSRQGNIQKTYKVGAGLLRVYLNGQLLNYDFDYSEVGTVGTFSNTIQTLIPLVVGDRLTFRIDSLGGFNVGVSSGGDVTGASNVGTGTGLIFKQKASGLLQLRNIKAGAGISIITSGDDIIISLTGGTTEPFFVNYITGQTSTIVNVGASYNLSTNKLDVYRNGVMLVNSTTAGQPVDRYQEATSNTILLALAPIASEIFTFVNQDTAPSFKNVITGIIGASLTVPSYTVGNNSLRVWRNGILMNTAGMGGAVDQYTETGSTIISLATAATSTDVFVITSGPIPSFREDQTGLSGVTVNLTHTYNMGTSELLVYRNGVLCYNSNTLGLPVDRYQELSSTSIQLALAATVTDTFTLISK